MESIDWGSLPFGYYKTDYNVRCCYRDKKWGELEVSDSEYVNLHIAATALHYGQEAFEGLKAFMGVDGKVRVFRMEENAKRMRASAKGVMMQEVPDEIFCAAVTKCVQMNSKYIPPYGTGASLYIRPLLIGSGAQVGVKPAKEYLFMVFVGPVGPYFKEGFKPVAMQIVRDYDRAAPLGTGNIKVGGNYAASLRAGERAHCEGLPNGGTPEVTNEVLQKVAFYTQTLGVPAQRNTTSPQFQSGEALFVQAQCSTCHLPQVTTGIHPTVPQLSNQTIAPFTDLLLHDMGEGLADGQLDFQASGSEWRTAPLWGIGLFETVNGHTYYLHDGRARNLSEAILWHGGEAQASRDAFIGMSATDREALLTYLASI